MYEPPTPWHHCSVQQTFKAVDSRPEGLSAEEAKQRLHQQGPNKLPDPQKRSFITRFISQFNNLLIYVLLVVMVITGLLGHWLDTGVIAGVVLINAIIGFIQEGRAEEALKAIRSMLSPNAEVIRGGRQQTIAVENLVIGDVVLLQPGDRIPADLRLCRAKGLQVSEAILTGESVAVDKQSDPVVCQTELACRSSMAYSGTLVTHGLGTGIVVATGINTELGQISELVSKVAPTDTPLLKQVASFGRWLTALILILATATFSFGVLIRDYPSTNMFLAAVSLAVAAIPEGLPAIMTITLAIGVERMARRQAVIRRLPAVETLGSVTVICTDKTGTLTRNEMTVRTIVTADNQYTLSGTGYNPHGFLMLSGQEILPAPDSPITQAIRAAVLCNDSTLSHKGQEWQIHGDPMEGALLVAGAKLGLDAENENRNYPRTDLIPFESEHRFMATLHHSHEGQAFIFLKGAPEQIIEMCHQQMTDAGPTHIQPDYWLGMIEQQAHDGQRLLAIAYSPTRYDQVELHFDDIGKQFSMLGLFGLIDPPREEAIEAVQACKEAGIRVKMITGDHALTARAIALQLGIINTDEALTGQQMDKLSEEALFELADRIDIYARVNPEHKMRLINTLQQHNHIVAMTGDGVNDAPALKRSDIGTAMGQNGTEAAKEASEMVLADDNFATITAAVEEGRAVYDNLQKAILFILPTNGGEALIILTAVLLGFQQLPLTPVQILWVNMITAVTLALSLAFEPKEKGIMQRPPRPTNHPLLNNHLIWRIGFVSVIIMGGTLGLFQWELGHNPSIERARTIAVNTLVMFEIFYLFNSRYILEPIFSRQAIVGNYYVLLAIALLCLFQLTFTYLPVMQVLFGTSAIEVMAWPRIIIIASSVFVLVEAEKAIMRRLRGKSTSNT
ncbi:cation-transporting P-type ATPase (plasmid) [Photobacterium sp. DA100]|uniref:cation-transporting P-type ATPase n=1 Tax=Photobacterium sp. DA100 TaxID=3027472 RepID=UPI00247B0329|nr:cation-transporting P-type ATPase [Photobacterium sp. DA100]WEM44370.1 cation-transporting P-type ATPase [Photobacterium sp. DA100]